MAGNLFYWEEVQEGQDIPPKTKGPITITDIVKFAGASGDYTPIHHDREYARNIAKLPDVILHGQCKIAFLSHMLSDWIGIEGTIKKLGAEYRAMDLLGSRVVSKGKVTRKYIEGDDHCVECEVWNENDKGEKTAHGYALVLLPSKGK